MILLPADRSATSLLSKQRIVVDTEGELVTLTIGNATIKMPYETAIQLSSWLRVRGKEAKRRAGDVSRHWTAIAMLTEKK